eukprot:TRINITY_DN396_c0_g1_i1.p1 TRINITY_DN396_c0_g1~~TRINITY_DN396_c0_g1_i1.p1  ORF type:complete len:184 (+),score=19.22 TRINITY_DN396_c0_g1_i1:382-933(+)
MEGYSRSVDLWSLGCIAFLLLRGHLPFDAKTKEEIIERTLHSPVKFDSKWDDIGVDAKDFVRLLLIKDPRKRLTLTGALNHSWFNALPEEIRKDIFLFDIPKSPVLEKLNKDRIARLSGSQSMRSVHSPKVYSRATAHQLLSPHAFQPEVRSTSSPMLPTFTRSLSGRSGKSRPRLPEVESFG